MSEAPILAAVATSGDYGDLTNAPDLTPYAPLAEATVEEYITNAPIDLAMNSTVGGEAVPLLSQLATVAQSGRFADLRAIPAGLADGDDDTLGGRSGRCTSGEIPVRNGAGTWECAQNFSGSYEDLTGKPSLAKVATTGSYEDLTQHPDHSIYALASALESADEEIADLREAIEELRSELDFPPGAVVAFGGTDIPSGWLLCDGRVLQVMRYPQLYGAIGNAHGGVANQTFNLPDLRGRFVRGVDHGAGHDPNRNSRTIPLEGGNAGDAVGSLQRDAFRRHTHDYARLFYAGLALGGGGYAVLSADVFVSSEPTGDDETRPVNIYLNYIIKAE